MFRASLAPSLPSTSFMRTYQPEVEVRVDTVEKCRFIKYMPPVDARTLFRCWGWIWVPLVWLVRVSWILGLSTSSTLPSVTVMAASFSGLD